MSAPAVPLHEYRIELTDGGPPTETIRAVSFTRLPAVASSDEWFVFQGADGTEIFRISSRYVISIRKLLDSKEQS